MATLRMMPRLTFFPDSKSFLIGLSIGYHMVLDSLEKGVKTVKIFFLKTRVMKTYVHQSIWGRMLHMFLLICKVVFKQIQCISADTYKLYLFNLGQNHLPTHIRLDGSQIVFPFVLTAQGSGEPGVTAQVVIGSEM